MKISSLTHVVVLSLIAMGAAHAGDVPTSTVKYGDLDLSRTEGAAMLYRRISQAARTVCAPLDAGQNAATALGNAYNHCLSEAVTGAVGKVHSPQFAAYVAEKTGAPATFRLASR